MWKEKLMNHKFAIIKTVAGIMVVVLACTGVGVYAASSDKNVIENNDTVNAKEDVQDDEEVKTLQDIIATQVGQSSDDVDKEESVFVVADANGAVSDVIVSDWLKNKDGADTIVDASDLTDIQNVKGDEEYKANGEDITWEAKGADIYYQGKTDKELPVDVQVKYYLDGEEMKAEDMVGKSGNVKIRFDYDNHEVRTANISGKDVDVYVPFTVMSAMVLPCDRFTNVTVTNGKVMGEGNNNIVMGLAFPGLTESLNVDTDLLDEKNIDIPEYVEVEAVTNDFALDMTLSVVLSDALSDIHLTDSIDLSELEDSMDELSDATGQLEDGTGTLADGVKTLNDKTGEFKDGAGELSDGVDKYTDGVMTLSDGIVTLLDGTGKLSDGASKLSDGASELNSRVQDITLPKVELTDEQKQQIRDAVAADANGDIAKGAQEMATTIGNQTSDVLTSNAATIVGNALSGDNSTIVSSIVGALMAQGIPQDQATNMVKAIAASTLQEVGATLGSQEVATNLYNGCKDGLTQSAASGALAGAEAVAGEVNSTLDSYSGKFTELKQGTEQLANGASEVADGAKQVNDGVTKLNDGATQLNSNSDALRNGADKLSDGSVQLSDGVAKLLDGANDLNDGMIKFDKEGISKLTDALEGDGKNALDRLNATMDAAKSYHTFTKLPENKEGSVKFIIRTQAVK